MKKKFYSLVLCALSLLTLESFVNNNFVFAQSFVSKPSKDATGVDAALLKVTANILTGAKRYTIELNTTPYFSDSSIVRASTVDNQRTLTFSNLKYATRYYARVKTDLSPQYGKVTSFTTRPEEFSYISLPANGAVNTDFSVLKVEVASVYQANRYTIMLSVNADFSGTPIIKMSYANGQRTFVFKDLEESTTYYARVKTDVSTGYGTTTSFTTRAAIAARRFWGITTSGGSANSGTVFSFSLDSLTFTKHHDNVSTEFLHGSLTEAPGGNFFGMGVQYSTGDGGEVFKISPDGSYSQMYNNGGIHVGSLMLAADNYLYVVDDWINSFRGAIRKLNPDGSSQDLIGSIFHKFRSDSDGKNPIAAPIDLNGYLYAMTPYGGALKKGVIYRKKLDGTVFQVLHAFNGVTGANPQGKLTEGADGYLYGLTFSGGVANAGTIFKVLPDGSNFTKLYDFNGVNGAYPFGELTQYGGFLYGMTSEGGVTDNGIIFKLNTDGTNFIKIFDFNGANGSVPMGSLTIDEADILYGMTSTGGINGLGVIFKINNNGSSFQKLYDFSGGGGNPDGSLLLVEDTFGKRNAIAARTLVPAETFATANTISVYPNPFFNSITVESTSLNEDLLGITMTDLSGRIVHQSQANRLTNFGSNLAQGVYILKVVKGNHVSTHQVVKQ